MTTSFETDKPDEAQRGPGRPKSTTEQMKAAAERQRERARVFAQEHNARIRAMTRLEQAAYKERRYFGELYDPYTPGERKEAEALRAEIDRLEAQARALNAQITHRLTREANLSHNEGKKALLQSFQNMRALRIELEPF